MSTANNDNTVSSPSDENLFNEPPQNEDCPICFLRLPTLDTGSKYNSCCGKIICSGCIYAPVYDNNGNKVKKKFPFCRAVAPESDEEVIKRTQKRVKMGDAEAMCNLGCDYAEGRYDLPQDRAKALDFWHRAGELGYSAAYYIIGNAYHNGRGVERDMEKAAHYYELAAIGGVVEARRLGDAVAIHNLGCFYAEGRYGFPQDYGKALELWHQSAELDHVHSYYNIGCAYFYGRGVERDEKKATYYWELAAIGGNTTARHNLGILECRAENYNRALKHFMISVEGGDHDCVKNIKQMYSKGYATRDDYAKALRAYQAYLEEVKSNDRDKLLHLMMDTNTMNDCSIIVFLYISQ